ncbi:hypothetical protein QYM36_010106 [Artemia franciscana]|uniref:Uncharacterized protein n=1 Tax=Artemia franciscana TaxID=6661 RepID=A0AA88L734_ARTSF|nr:hypothetical protein QYM36_010106 [Artemia franciscana]
MTGLANRPEQVVYLVSLSIWIETSSLLGGGTAIGPRDLRKGGDVNACSGDDGSESACGEGGVPNGEMFPAPNDDPSKMGLGE